MYLGKDKQMSPRINMYVYASSLLIALSLTATPLFAEEDASEPPLKVVEETSLERGKEIFTNLCAYCHKTTYEDSMVAGTGLQGLLERRDEAWLDKWLKNPSDFARTNVMARDLIDSNPYGLAMPALPAMQDDAKRKAVIEHLKTLK